MTTIGDAAQEIQTKISSGVRILDYIDNENLITCVTSLFRVIHAKTVQISEGKVWHKWDFWKNGVDPFATVASTIVSGKNSIEDHLLEVEKVRQIDKAISNSIGYFHQNILGHLDGCINPGMNGEIDLIVKRPGLKLIAELKNKWNTTKGDDKTQPYDKLARLIGSDYHGYIGYYVCIISKPIKAKGYNVIDKPFTPSKKKVRRPLREDIREIDGLSFYDLLIGRKDSLLDLYEVFPKLLAYCINLHDPNKKLCNLIDDRDSHFKYLWSHIYTANHGGIPPR
ncbi:MAG: Eco47II family restriction endonuclease [Gammaproteobacteria bacterium]|nr:Eco47II family restriction endonuclease [Gammaproteobacteria bacterium]